MFNNKWIIGTQEYNMAFLYGSHCHVCAAFLSKAHTQCILTCEYTSTPDCPNSNQFIIKGRVQNKHVWQSTHLNSGRFAKRYAQKDASGTQHG